VTRFTEPLRTSPTAKTPGRSVLNDDGEQRRHRSYLNRPGPSRTWFVRVSFHQAGRCLTELHFSMSAWFRPSNATASAQASAFDKQVGVIIADEGKLLFATIEGGHSLKCRKGANRVTLAVGRPLPVYPDERTSSVYSGMCNTNPLCRGWGSIESGS
jgi:hypothetical protein